MTKIEPGTSVFDTITNRKVEVFRFFNENFIVITLWIDNKTENKYFCRRKLDEIVVK